jgi:uncharacterized Tic20 family protein
MLLLNIICILCVAFGIIIAIIVDSEVIKNKFVLTLVFMLCFLSVTAGLILRIQETRKVIHSQRYKHKIEIRQEIVNGQLVSVDTVYIFTRK